MRITALEDASNAIMANPLAYPGLPKRNDMRTLVRFWHDPSFEHRRSWSLYETNDAYYVRRILLDQHRSHHLQQPVTYASEAMVPAQIATELMGHLYGIHVSPFVRTNNIGIDGEIYGIEFGSYWLSCRLSWWCDPPDGWEPLSDWFTDAQSKLDSLLPVHVDD